MEAGAGIEDRITPASARAPVTPARAALIALTLGALLAGARLATFDGNPSGFVWAGDQMVERTEAPANLIVRDGAGFDGTGFYRLALDPATRAREDFGIWLDHPAFRHQRILYPLLGWAVTGGDPVAVAWALIAINLAGLAAIGWLGARLVLAAGRPAWWGLAFALNPAYALALGVDTAEIVAGVGLLGALLLLRERRYGLATGAMIAGMLARETTLILAAGVLVAAVLGRSDRARAPWWVGAVPIGAYLVWQAVLSVWWGVFALGTGAGLDIGAPFVGIARAARTWLPPEAALDGLHAVFLIAIAAFGVMAARSVSRGAGLVHERASLVLALVLIALTSEAIWFHHWGFLRANAEVYALGAVVVLSDARAPVHRLILAPAIFASLWINMLLFP